MPTTSSEYSNNSIAQFKTRPAILQSANTLTVQAFMSKCQDRKSPCFMTTSTPISESESSLSTTSDGETTSISSRWKFYSMLLLISCKLLAIFNFCSVGSMR